MSHKRLTRPVLLGIMFPAAIFAGLFQTASAEQSRRSNRKSQPAPVSRTAPDVTATIPQSQPTVAPTIADPPLKPFFLPSAPRTRMRTCGLKWQDVKMSGRAGDETWREFATKCLAERDGTEAKAQR